MVAVKYDWNLAKSSEAFFENKYFSTNIYNRNLKLLLEL